MSGFDRGLPLIHPTIYLSGRGKLILLRETMSGLWSVVGGWVDARKGLLRVRRNELICERYFRRDAVVSVYVRGLQEVIRCADERSVSQLLSQLH